MRQDRVIFSSRCKMTVVMGLLFGGLIWSWLIAIAQAQDTPPFYSTTPILEVWYFQLEMPPDRSLDRAREALKAANLDLLTRTATTDGGTSRYLYAIIECKVAAGGTSGDVMVASYPGHDDERRRIGIFLRDYMVTGQNPSAVGGVSIRTQKAVYAPNEKIVVEYSGLPGNPQDWILLAKAGAADDAYDQWVYTQGKRDRTYTFNGLPEGQYEARVHFNWPAGGNTVHARYTFTVGGAPPPAPVPGIQVRTQKPAYAPNEPIVVEYFNLPGNAQDWIVLVKAGAPDGAYDQWLYTGGKRDGTYGFNGLPAGQYEARVYLNWPAGGNTVHARYAFTVGTTGGTGGICDDPQTLAVMDEWLARAVPPQEPGESLRYESWGRVVGTSRSVVRQILPYPAASGCGSAPRNCAQRSSAPSKNTWNSAGSDDAVLQSNTQIGCTTTNDGNEDSSSYDRRGSGKPAQRCSGVVISRGATTFAGIRRQPGRARARRAACGEIPQRLYALLRRHSVDCSGTKTRCKSFKRKILRVQQLCCTFHTVSHGSVSKVLVKADSRK
jgi:hypothetical protein